MQKLHKNWGGAKELQLRKRIGGQSFGLKFETPGAFSSVCREGGNAPGEERFQTSVILEDGRHGVLFTSSNRRPGKLCYFLILSLEEFAWTPVYPGLGSLDRSGI